MFKDVNETDGDFNTVDNNDGDDAKKSLSRIEMTLLMG